MAFDRNEMEQAFARYRERAEQAGQSGNWDPWADQFTEDAVYLEHMYGKFHGREEIRRWITKTMTRFPGSAMPTYPNDWHIIDTDRGWIVTQIENRMQDPGDGSVFEAYNLTVLHYAGNDTWSYEEDVYNPSSFMSMIMAWCRRAEELDNLPDDAKVWLDLVKRAS